MAKGYTKKASRDSSTSASIGFEEKMVKLDEQFKESARLERAIRKNLEGPGYGV